MKWSDQTITEKKNVKLYLEKKYNTLFLLYTHQQRNTHAKNASRFLQMPGKLWKEYKQSYQHLQLGLL